MHSEGPTGYQVPAEDVRYLLNLPDEKKKQNPTTWIKDIAPVITSIAALVISYLVYNFNAQHTRVADAELRAKCIQALYDIDPTKREMGAVTVAEYGLDMMPGLTAVLNSSNGVIRGGAVVGITELFLRLPAHDKLFWRLSAHDKETLLKTLERYLREGGPSLVSGTAGVFANLINRNQTNLVAPVLTSAEAYVKGNKSAEGQEATEAMVAITHLLHVIISNAVVRQERMPAIQSARLLLRIADSSLPLEARKEALKYLGKDELTVPKLSLEDKVRKEFLAPLVTLKRDPNLSALAEGAESNFER